MFSMTDVEGIQTIKRYKISSKVDIEAIHNLPHIVTLCMFKDAILSAVRWHRLVREDDAVEATVDRTFAIAAGAGWAFEAIKLLRDLRDEGVISAEFVHRLPELEPVDPRRVWQHAIENESNETKAIKKIRNRAFAHFYDRNESKAKRKYKLAWNAIRAVAKGELDTPFVEWREIDGVKHNFHSSNTFAMMAICQLLFDIRDGKMPDPPLAIGDHVLEIGILLEHVIAGLIDELVKRSEIAFEPYNDDVDLNPKNAETPS